MVTSEVAWHGERRRRIRRNHPEILGLQGHEPLSGGAALVLVPLQLGIAAFLSERSLWWWLPLTLTVGPTVAHALGVLIHEGTHNLIAKSSFANKIWLLVCNLPLGAPAAFEFRAQHLLHHRYLGDADGSDTQAPTRSEERWVGGSTWRKLLSFTFGRFFYKSRPANKVAWDGWMVANWVTSLGVSVTVWWLWGGGALAYLVVSSLLAFGPHTWGARRLSEHLPVVTGQPTNSYYGPLNWVSFNVGYHVEHHDFPDVAWTKVRRLRDMAQEEYAPLFSFRSWTRLIVSYVRDSRYRVRHYVGMGPVLDESVVREGGSATPLDPRAARSVKQPSLRQDIAAAG